MRLTEEYLTRMADGETGLPAERIGPSALVLGSFDGLHRGHQELIRGAREAQRRRGLAASVVFTFRSHPRIVLARDRSPFLLTTWREKLSLLQQSGVDVVVAADFCPALARLDYRDFVARFLVEFLGMRHFVAGHDVHLGAGRRGNARTLEALGDELDYSFELCSALREGDQIVSSSAIRNALTEGDLATAAAMLGRPYALWGEVTPGDQRGRTIGYPTANITPFHAQKLLPKPGVYAVRVQLPGDVAQAGRRNGVLGWVHEPMPEIDRSGVILSSAESEWAVFGGMLNYGKVPTFHSDGLTTPRVEAHVFEFDGDLRGRTVKVEWMERLRDERKFAGVDELTDQLARDSAQARRALCIPERDD
ncbi:MAG: bifunctional riboflavin kinase/FMN adenylyltransferase [Candidatus Krumholzibacteriia bacterium]